MASVWTGYLTFGLISMPVRLHSGARGSRVGFHMLHRYDNSRVRQQLVCAEEDKPVGRDEIVKGYEYRKGEYVVIEPDEIKAIEPKTAKAMEILEFVKNEVVDPVYFDASYYVMPDEAARKPYALLVHALRESGYVGVAKVTMHNREYTAFLRPTDEGGIVLHTMFYSDEVREVEGFRETDDLEVREAELKVARQLIEALAGEWDPTKYYDTYEENLKKLIKAKLEGQEVVPVAKPAKAAPVTDLMEALKQSLAAMEGKKKPVGRVEAAQRESELQLVPAGSQAAKKAAKGTRKKKAA